MRRLPVAGLAVVLVAALRAPAGAQVPPTPSALASTAPAASPSPSASPSPTPFITPAPAATPTPHVGRVTWTNLFVTNAAVSAVSGSGASPPEAAGFIGGSPVAPGTPYDFFTAGVATNGTGASVQLRGIAEYATSGGWDVQLGYGFGALQGGANTIGYWNEPFFPVLDPHFSGNQLSLPVAFPSHAGQDDTAGIRAAVTNVRVAFDRGGWTFDAGYFQPSQTLRFVFIPAPNAVLPLGVMPALAETLTSGSPTLDGWNQLDPAIPLLGAELVVAAGKSATIAFDEAALPSLPGTQTRWASASLGVDRGNGNQFGVQLTHANESGAPILAGVLFGADPQLDAGPQGNLPTSRLFSQRQTIVGVRQALHRGRDYGVIEIGRSWYDADPAPRPSGDGGGYYRAGYAHDFGAGTLQIDGYRFEPRYAQMVLPYGTPENIWSIAWSWPGVWLKSTYQLVDNSVAGINRQGFRVKWSGSAANVRYGVALSQYHQVEPETRDNALQEGFADGFYLPEAGEATIGEDAQAAAFATWSLPFADVTADLVDDAFHRPGNNPRDRVSYDVPQYIFSASKTMGATVAALGVGRYGMYGSWASAAANVNLAQRQLFAGVQTRLPSHQTLLVQFRRLLTAGVSGVSSIPANATGNVLVVEDRISI